MITGLEAGQWPLSTLLRPFAASTANGGFDCEWPLRAFPDAPMNLPELCSCVDASVQPVAVQFQHGDPRPAAVRLQSLPQADQGVVKPGERRYEMQSAVRESVT
jgi:hypothetical protein